MCPQLAERLVKVMTFIKLIKRFRRRKSFRLISFVI